MAIGGATCPVRVSSANRLLSLPSMILSIIARFLGGAASVCSLQYNTIRTKSTRSIAHNVSHLNIALSDSITEVGTSSTRK